MFRRLFIITLLLSTIAVAQNPNRINQLSDLKLVTVGIGSKSLKCWLMDTDSRRAEGMMFLTEKETPLDRGMLFVYSSPLLLSYWNGNVPIDLDLAYLDANGMVMQVLVLKKNDRTSRPSTSPTKYVLEMRRGGFAKYKIKVGTRIAIPKTVKSADGG